MPNLKLINGNNQEAVYENVETIKVPTEDGSTQIYETYKERQTKTVSLSMSEGNQTITPDENMLLTSVTIEKPADLIPENIKEGADIGGVIGTLVVETSSDTTEDTTTETTTLTRPTASTLSIDSENGTINVTYSNSIGESDKPWATEALFFNNDSLLASNVLTQIDAEFQLMLLQYMFYRDIKKNGIDSGTIEETNETYQAYKKAVYMYTSSMMTEFGLNYGLAKRCDTALGNVPIDDFISGMFLNFNLNAMFVAGATTPTFEYTDLGRLMLNHVYGIKNKYEMRHGYSQTDQPLSDDSNALIVKCSMLNGDALTEVPLYISISAPSINTVIGKNVNVTGTLTNIISDEHFALGDTLYTSDKNIFKVALDSTDFNIYKFNTEFVLDAITDSSNPIYVLCPIITTQVGYAYDSENGLLTLEDDGDDNCGMYIMSNLNLLKKPTPSISIDESGNITVAFAEVSDIDVSARALSILHNGKSIYMLPYSATSDTGAMTMPATNLSSFNIDINDGKEHVLEVFELPVEYSLNESVLDETTYWVASDKATLTI